MSFICVNKTRNVAF
jgi:hypothetical protein